MKRIILLVIICYSSSFSFAQGNEDQAIDSIFSAWNNPNNPGCALGIIKNGELIYARGYGLANMEHNIPNTPSTVFRIASTSKQFTAACIVLLAEQGKLNLEDNLKSFFPDFPQYSEKITIRHLLNHTSGIRDYLTIAFLKGLGKDDYYHDTDIMNWLVNQTDLNFHPGSEYLYSNSGYWLLGQIVNKIAGINMADFAQQEIFKPLGMTNTHFHNNHNQIVKNRASGYFPINDTDYNISMTTLDMIGDGGIFTSINDIKKWDDAYYNSTVLSKTFWEKMTQRGVLNNGEIIDYASGLMIKEYKGLKTVRHGGSFVGFKSEFLRFPEQKLSIAIFANRADARPLRKAYALADLLLKEDFKNDKIDDQDQNEIASYNYIKLKSKELKKFTGHYWNNTGSYSRKIYLKNDTLRYYRRETSESDLVPISNNEFKMLNVNVDVSVKFLINKEGNLTMSFSVNRGDPTFSKQYDPRSYSIPELAAFEGTYYSKELDVEYTLKRDNDLLMLYIKETKISALKSIMANMFTNAKIGTFLFNTDSNGKILGFKLAAGRVKNLNFLKK